MTLESFYLMCFFVGLGLSVISFFSGALHLHIPGKLHIPHATHGPRLSAGGRGLAGRHAGTHASDASGASLHSVANIPFFNFSSMMAFLCWFGGMGYLLTEYAHMWAALALLLATITGFAGAAIVFWFLAKFLMGHERPLNPEDFEMTGVVGTVSSGLREQGTGEIVFLQAGTRRVCGARSSDGSAIPKGSEVVVTGFAKGIACVRPWSQFAAEHLLVEDEHATEG